LQASGTGKNRACSRKAKPKSSQNPHLKVILNKQKEPTLESSQHRLFSYPFQVNEKMQISFRKLLIFRALNLFPRRGGRSQDIKKFSRNR